LGECAAAAARWELLLGRLVPEPTEAGQHGKVVTGILSDGKIASQYDRGDRRHCGYPLRFRRRVDLTAGCRVGGALDDHRLRRLVRLTAQRPKGL
jgi:hypothetical protein